MLVYEIKNLVTGDLYYGSTRRKFDVRKREHIRHATKRKHPLYDDFRVFGLAAFIWREVAVCSSEDEMSSLEKRLISESRDLTRKYNLYVTGSGKKPASHRSNISIARTGQKHTKATKKKISESKKGCVGPNAGKTFGPETRARMKLAALKRSRPFICRESGEHFSSLNDAAVKLGIDKSSIHKNLRGKYLKAGKGLSFYYLPEGGRHFDRGDVE